MYLFKYFFAGQNTSSGSYLFCSAEAEASDQPKAMQFSPARHCINSLPL